MDTILPTDVRDKLGNRLLKNNSFGVPIYFVYKNIEPNIFIRT